VQNKSEGTVCGGRDIAGTLGPAQRYVRFAWCRVFLSLVALLAISPIPVQADLFHAPTFYSVRTPWNSAIFDANRDGLPDLLVTQGSTDSAMVLLNVGNGLIENGWSFWPGPVPAGVVSADFNADSFDDVAIACQSETLSVLLSQPGGGFSNTKYYAHGQLLGIASGDFNNDEAPDLVLAGTDYGIVHLWANSGSGGFSFWRSYVRGGSIQTVAPGDFDRDGNLDVAASNSWTTTLLVLRGPTLSPNYAAASDAQTSVVTADFDGDGFLDLAATAYWNYLTFVLRGRGDGTFDPPIEIWGLPGYQHALDVADFNLDGHPDLAVSSKGRVLILLGNGDCTFAPPIDIVLPNRFGTLRARAGDLDGNDSPDLIVCQTHLDTVAVFLNTMGTVTAVDDALSVHNAVPLRARVMPNPAVGHFSVAIELPEAGRARLDLLDVQGRLIETRDLGSSGGRQQMSIGSQSRLRPGVYLIRVTCGDRAVTTRACIVN
jgi:FG-GAP-like repeat